MVGTHFAVYAQYPVHSSMLILWGREKNASLFTVHGVAAQKLRPVGAKRFPGVAEVVTVATVNDVAVIARCF